MSLRAQICSSPIADMTVTTRSFPSANPSLIYIQESIQRYLISMKCIIYQDGNKKSPIKGNLAEQIVIGGKPQIILGVSIFS